MALVDSLLTAMVRANGDALVMHVGEKPIVVAGPRTIDLSGHGMTLGAMVGMLGQLLPTDAQSALQEFGAVEHRLPDRDDDRFSVVAARGGDDIWIEIRRRRKEAEDEARRARNGTHVAAALVPEPETPAVPALDADAVSVPEAAPSEAVSPGAAPSETVPVEPEPANGVPAAVMAVETAPADDVPAVDVPAFDTELTDVAQTVEAAASAEIAPADAGAEQELTVLEAALVPETIVNDVTAVIEPILTHEAVDGLAANGTEEAEPQEMADAVDEPVVEPVMVEPIAVAVFEAESTMDVLAEAQAIVDAYAAQTPEPVAEEEPVPVAEAVALVAGHTHETVDVTVAEHTPQQVSMDTIPTSDQLSGGGSLPPGEASASAAPAVAPSAPAGESPVMRTVRIEVPSRAASPRTLRVNGLLRTAADMGASDLFLLSQARPAVRVDGSIRTLDQEPPVPPADVEAILAELTPEPWRDAVGRGDPAEWLIELAEVGRVRCTVFRDHRGPGANFHFTALHPASIEQLGLSGDAWLLASEPDGLIVLAGPGPAERTTLVAAVVDSINRQRSDYVITLEPQVRVQHEARQALLSQREVGNTPERQVEGIRAALREEPDVLVIEDVDSADAAQLAIDASTTGRLVIVSVPGTSAPGAVRRLLEHLPIERRSSAAQVLSHSFRGALAQLQLRRTSGGRVAAREVWLATTAVIQRLAEGDMGALGTDEGADPLLSTFVGYVQSGVVDVREAFRRAPEPSRLRDALRAAGVDTAPIDRFA